MYRILTDARHVVAVLVAASDAVNALANQIVKAVRDLRLLAPTVQATHQRLAQAQALVAGLEQQRPAIGARIRLVEARHHRLAELDGVTAPTPLGHYDLESRAPSSLRRFRVLLEVNRSYDFNGH